MSTIHDVVMGSSTTGYTTGTGLLDTTTWAGTGVTVSAPSVTLGGPQYHQFHVHPTPGGSMPHIQARTQTLIDGYVGQILVDNDIVWQSWPKSTAEKALKAAQKRIQTRTARQYA